MGISATPKKDLAPFAYLWLPLEGEEAEEEREEIRVNRPKRVKQWLISHMKYFMASRTMITNHSGCPHSIPNDDGRDHFILESRHVEQVQQNSDCCVGSFCNNDISAHFWAYSRWRSRKLYNRSPHIYLPHMDKSLCDIARRLLKLISKYFLFRQLVAGAFLFDV